MSGARMKTALNGGPARPAVVDRPNTVHGFAVRHEQRGRVPLIDLFRAGGDNHVSLRLAGEVDGGNLDHPITGLGLIPAFTARARLVGRHDRLFPGNDGSNEKDT